MIKITEEQNIQLQIFRIGLLIVQFYLMFFINQFISGLIVMLIIIGLPFFFETNKFAKSGKAEVEE